MAYPKNDEELRTAVQALGEFVNRGEFSKALRYIDEHELMNRAENHSVLTRDYAVLHIVVADAYFQLSKQTKDKVQQDIAEDHYKTALFIDKTNKWAKLGYGDVQLDKGKNYDAMVTYRGLMFQFHHPKDENDKIKNDEIIRVMLDNKKFVNKATKSEVFDLMKLLPMDEQKEMLNSVIQKKGLLGARIWKKEGLTVCKLGHGMLQEVQKQLDHIAKRQGLDNAGVEMQTRKHQ